MSPEHSEGMEQAENKMAKALEQAESPEDFARKIDGVVADFSRDYLKKSSEMVDKVRAAGEKAKKMVGEQWETLKTKESRTAEKTVSIISRTFDIPAVTKNS
jgi:hypothetical protein